MPSRVHTSLTPEPEPGRPETTRSVHRLRLLGPGGDSTETANIFCPRHLRTKSLESCLACPQFVRAANDSIACLPGPSDQPPQALRDLRLGGDVCVGDAMGCATACVLADVRAPLVARWLKEQSTSFAIVVQTPNRFVGLLDFEAATSAHEGIPAGDFARYVRPVGEASPLAFAVERMVHERARALPVADGEGLIVALLTDIDALRWVAHRERKT